MPLFVFLGALLILIGFVLSQTDPSREGTVATLQGLGLLFNGTAMAMYLVGNWQRLKSFSSKRSTKLGFSSILAILLMIGIMFIINFLAVRHGGRWDLSETQRFSLAPQTLKVLSALKKNIRILVFTHERSPGFSAYRDLLDAYSHASPHIQVSFIDPEKEPQVAREFNITKVDTAVFQRSGQTFQVTKPTEANLTSGLLRVTHNEKNRIVFLEGHGERRIRDNENGGLSFFRERLETQGYEISRGLLSKDTAILRNTTMVIIAGPREPLTDSDALYIQDFVHSGGRVLFLIDPETTSGLAPLLAQWGLTLGPGIIVDPVDRVSQSSPTFLLVRRFTKHAITNGFTAPLLLRVSQDISFEQAKALRWSFTSLIQSSEESWAETDFSHKNPKFEVGEDRKGPFPLAAAMEFSGHTNHSSSHPSAVIIGNSALASNAYAKFPGNTDFLLNTVAWLTQEDALISISVKDPTFEPFIPNPTQEHMLLAIQVFSLPLLLSLLGITICRRRSQL